MTVRIDIETISPNTLCLSQQVKALRAKLAQVAALVESTAARKSC
ncbi:MAG: hypothetical protein PVF45_04345 [Anaerolineae bacterium]|jgi:hypothetical protein